MDAAALTLPSDPHHVTDAQIADLRIRLLLLYLPGNKISVITRDEMKLSNRFNINLIKRVCDQMFPLRLTRGQTNSAASVECGDKQTRRWHQQVAPAILDLTVDQIYC